eukprot:gene6321-6807_t
MNEFEDLFSYQHLRNSDAFLDNIVSFFKRKYADEKAIPQDRIKACLEGFYHNIRSMDESHINKAYLERAYKSVFPNKMHSEMRASLESRIVQALKGLVVVVAISSLLERQGFVHPSSTLSSGNVVADAAFNHHIPPIYQPHHVYDEFQTWLNADQNYSADEDEQQYFSSSDVSEIDELEDWEFLASFPHQEIKSLNIAAVFAELTAY